jgi:hypothetical protein
MWARINAAAPTADGLGYANPLIYGLDATTRADDFYDVTTGANGLYAASAGWDYPTGWGVPDVENLMIDLAGGTTPRVGAGTGGGGTGGDDGGFVPPADACAAGAIPVTDPEGDATMVLTADTAQPATNAPALDVRTAAASVDPDSGELHFDITVTDLSQMPPSGSVGGYYRFTFDHDGGAYTIVAARRVLPSGTTDRFSIAVTGLTSSSTAVTGSFGDVGPNTIRIVVPASVFATVSGADPSGRTVAFTNIDVVGQRDDGQITATADDAPGTCSQVLTFPVLVSAVVPETPLGVLLPISSLVLLAGGMWILRRRRSATL